MGKQILLINDLPGYGKVALAAMEHDTALMLIVSEPLEEASAAISSSSFLHTPVHVQRLYGTAPKAIYPRRTILDSRISGRP